MAILDGKALTEARRKRDWTQVDLSEATKPKVDVSTISRIERGKRTRVRANTLSALAKALDVQPKSLSPRAEADRDVMKLRVETAARNALSLVAIRYGISRENIIEIAPLLFFIAAEQSLKERRSRIAEFKASAHALQDLYSGIPHLPVQGPIDERVVRSEERSIDARDLFGEKVLDYTQQLMIDLNYDFDEAEQNPFVRFLRNSISNITASTELTRSVRWTPGLWPSYQICLEEAALIVGNDPTARNAILFGAAALHEMPKGTAEQRAAWARAESDRKDVDLNDLLDDNTAPQIADAQAPNSGAVS